MSGALVGFRIDGNKKLLQLHGERTCAGVLGALLGWLRHMSDYRLHDWARAFDPTNAQSRHYSPFPDAQPARLDACADVPWGFLLVLNGDFSAGELHIYINRHARFAWRDIGETRSEASGAMPCCTLNLAHARKLAAEDLATLQGLLHQNFYSDGVDPLLPLRAGARDALSAPFPAPADWLARLQLSEGRARLLLEKDGLQATVRQVSELTLDHPHCGSMLHETLAEDVLAMTRAIYGPGATLGQTARVAEQMALLPYEPDAGGLPLLALGLNPNSGLDIPLGPAFFDDLRARFLLGGMSVQGWRFLIKQDNAVIRFILQFFPPSARILRGYTHFINLLASALQSEPLSFLRCQPALRGVERILDRTRGRPGPVREENARIFLRAVMRAQLSHEEEANLTHEAQDVSDFVYEHPAVLKGATWKSLCRRSDDWHRSLLIQVDPAKDVRWPALLPHLVVGSLVAVELDTGYLLAEDGLEQRHCIGTYANACASGSTRVFSLRQHNGKESSQFGKRVATLELQRGHDGQWRLMQIRGKANTPIQDPLVLQAADEVVRSYAEAARAQAASPRVRAEPKDAGYYSPQPYVIHRQEHWTG